ncbi:hypothetical protein SRABI128_03685 [Microbacterium sp. Bi128]|nr:hypothetical protein SRABI128_03685 [Microbacterium sp. Bi128]
MLRGLFCQVVVEAAEHGQFGELFIGDLDGAQCVGHGPGRFGDDERVPGVGFRFARVQVRDPAHRQPGQVSDGDTGGLGNRDGECTDRRGLVNDQQNAAVFAQRSQYFAQPGLVVGQSLVEELHPRPVHCNGVVLAVADVQADEDINAFVVSDHLYLAVTAADTCAGLSAVSEPASTLRTTIPNCPASISGLSGTYRTPVTTPPGSLTTGGGNHAGAGRPAYPHPATGTGYEKGNGAAPVAPTSSGGSLASVLARALAGCGRGWGADAVPWSFCGNRQHRRPCLGETEGHVRNDGLVLGRRVSLTGAELPERGVRCVSGGRTVHSVAFRGWSF